MVAMVYNELALASRGTAFVVSLLVGIWAVCIPQLGPLLLVLAFMWVVVDLINRVKWLRPALVVVATGAVVFGSVWLAFQSVKVTGFSTTWSQWQAVAYELSARGTPLKVHCVGCVRGDELQPLTFLLSKQGWLAEQSNSTKVFVIIPPYSNQNSLIYDTLVVRVGELALAWPAMNL